MKLLAAALAATAIAFVPAADHTAPTRPGPLQVDLSSGGVVLRWAPSTDDRGPVRYELTESDRPVATVTGTEYRYSSSPPPPRIYILAVRAVDEAGNVSAAAYQTLGRVWRGDEVPPAPAGLGLDRAGRGLVELSWTAPALPPGWMVPPVAGYEVELDGQPVGQVGATRIVLARPARGPHTFTVRTINAVDQRSAAAELTIGRPAS